MKEAGKGDGTLSQPRGCPTVELSAFLDGELASSRAATVESHLASCGTCQVVARDERTLRRSLLLLACPAAEVLAAYAEGSMDAKAQAGIERHVSRCAACSDVVAWTRQAGMLVDSGEIAREPVVPRRRRGRPVVKKAPAPILRLMVPIAAAASIAAVAFLMIRAPGTDSDVALRDLSPTPSPSVQHETPRPTPRASQAPAPRPSVQASPEATESPAPELTPETPGPSPEASPPAPETSPTAVPAPVESERPQPAQSPAAAVEPTTTVAIALAGGDLRVGPSREKAVRASGAVTVSSKDLLFAASSAARFRVGETDVLLSPTSEARLGLAEGRPRLALEKGESFVEGSGRKTPDLELACKGAVARASVPGSKLLLRVAPRGAELLCQEGQAVFACAAGQVALGAGEASEVESDAAPTRPHAADAGRLTTWVTDARAERALAQGVDYPRGFLAGRAVATLAGQLAPTVALPARARALYAIEAARAADERLARIADLAAPDADAAFDDVMEKAAGDALAAPDAALAALARARRLAGTKAGTALQKRLPKLLAALGKAVEKAPADASAQLAGDLDTLLAAKPLHLAPAKIAALGQKPAGQDATTASLEALARAVFSGQAPEDADALLKTLDQTLAKDPTQPANQLTPVALLAADRSAAAAGNAREDERRSGRVLAQLAAKGRVSLATPANAAAALLVLARDAQALFGRAVVTAAAPSVVIVERGDKLEVTFSIESARRPKVIQLEGSWDNWAEAEPMTRRADGTFVETIVLPRGRYQYKLRLDTGKVWEPDAKNPLTQADGMGGVNSVLEVE